MKPHLLRSLGMLLTGLATTVAFGATPGQARPNFLFCIADDQSFAHLSANGCPWVKTPAIDGVAREGLLFLSAYTPNAKCAPSRASILTGRYPWQLEAAANHMCFFPPRFRTFPESLAAHGYHVGVTGKAWGPGLALNADGSPRTNMVGRVYAPTPGKDYASAFRRFLADRGPDQPFCFWMGSTEPHRPYVAGSALTRGDKKLSDIDRVPAFWPDNETVRGDLLDYGLEVEMFDAQVAAVLQVLAESGRQADTLVIVTSDNGMPFPRSKGNTYEISNHMPLAVRWPKGIRNPGRKIADPVSFIDFAPTFLELARVPTEGHGMQPLEGRSLVPILQDEARGGARDRGYVLVGRERNDWGRPNLESYPTRGIVQDRHLLLLNFKPERWPACNPETDYPDCDASPTKKLCAAGREQPALARYWELCFGKRPGEELYDLASDPDCVRNLAGDPAQATRLAALKTTLLDQLRRQQDPRVTGNGDLFDQYLPTRKEWIGQFERVLAGETNAPAAPPRKAAKAKRKASAP